MDVLDQHQGEGELVPAAEHLDDGDRYQDGLAHGHDDAPHGAGEAGAVDGRGLLQGDGDALDIAFHQEDAHGQAETDVGQKQREPLVGHVHFLEHDVDGHQQGVDGDQHAGEEQQVQRAVPLALDAGENVAHDEGEQHNAQDADGRGAHGVPHGLEQVIVRVGEDAGVVFQRGGGRAEQPWDGQLVGVKDALDLQGVVGHPDQRENAAQGENPQHRVHEDAAHAGGGRQALLLPGRTLGGETDHASTPFVARLTIHWEPPMTARDRTKMATDMVLP